MVAPDLVDRVPLARAVRALQLRVVSLGIAFSVLTVIGVLTFNAPRAGIPIAVVLGTVITAWGWWWYGSLARAVRGGTSVLAVVVTRKVSWDHAYVVAQPIDGGPALTFVVPSRRRVVDGHPAAMTGDRSSGRLILSSATTVSIPLRAAYRES